MKMIWLSLILIPKSFVEGQGEGVDITSIMCYTAAKGDTATIDANVDVHVEDEVPAQDQV